MISERVTVKRIGPASALKIGAVVGLVMGVIYAVLVTLFIDDAAERVALLCTLVFVGPIGGGISAPVAAWVYNIAFNVTGGLHLEVSFGRDGDGADKGVPPSIGSMMSHDE